MDLFIKSRLVRHISMLATISLTAFAWCACEKNPSPEDAPERIEITSYDDLRYFQDYFVEEDTLGQFVSHSMGEPLYENDPTNLYIGVDDVEEAREIWLQTLAPDVKEQVYSPSPMDATATLTDRDGKKQGTVSFTVGSGATVAEITTDAPALRHFKKVTFIPRSAWPVNSGSSLYDVGDVVKFNIDNIHWVDGPRNFVCIQEASCGQNAIFVALTKEDHGLGDDADHDNNTSMMIYYQYVPGASKFKKISAIIRSNWDFFKAAFKEAGGHELDGAFYWVDEWELGWGFTGYQHCMRLTDDYEYGEEVNWHNQYKPMILKIDWADFIAPLYYNEYVRGTQSSATEDPCKNLVDGLTSTHWFAWNNNKVDGKWYIEFQSEDPMTITAYTLYSSDHIEHDDNHMNNPKHWKLYGKRTEGGEWKLLDEQKDKGLSTHNSTPITFTLDKPRLCQYLRLEIFENWGGVGCEIGEITFEYDN